MVEQPGRVWSRGALLERVKGTDFSGYERNIDGHIKNLRKKLGEHLGQASAIRSVYGVGYGLETEALE
jgi:DNA-binding response OmpR family regulator